MMTTSRSLKKKLLGTSAPVASLALALMLCVGVPGIAQDVPPQNSDLGRGQLSSIDEFLEAHPEMAEQLRKDPALVNDQRFVEEHPALQQYLQQHPEIREEFRENPNSVLQEEQRFDHREDMRGQRGRMEATDEFFEAHPEIAEQLRKDPRLVNDQHFVQEHPALQQYLQQHPEIREEFQANPGAFMQQERQFDRREDTRGQRGRMGATDEFFEGHPEIAEQLRKDPSLVNNPHFVQGHPALQQYLQEHPEIREEFQTNPNAFMQQEGRFDRHEDAQGQLGRAAATDRFLDSHPEVAEQLRKDPSLVNNHQFVQGHPALQEYLQEHPEVREQFQGNPTAFMQQQQRFEEREGSFSRTPIGQPMNFSQFLNSHASIAQQLSHDPSLLNSKEYLEEHPALQQYLQAHPQAKQEFSDNPGAFLNTQEASPTASATKSHGLTSKPKQ